MNLEKNSGLPIEIGKDYKLKFHEKLPEVKPSIRKFKDVVPVLMDKKAKSDRDEMYYMYRDVHFPEHEEIIRHHKVRYDITVIPPGILGKEFNKTVGHYHPNIPGSEIAYPETYEVIHGQALFLIQKMDKDFKDVNTVLAIRANTGQKVIYPPNYGHIMVNIGSDVLVTANWASDQFESLYQPVADRHGMAYYIVKSKNEQFSFEPNPNYDAVPEVRILEANENPGAKMLPEFPLYNVGVVTPDKLEFLNNPAKFAIQLSSISS